MFELKGWSRGELWWLVIATAIVCWGSYNGPILEFAAAITNVYCVILVAKGRISNYYWGMAGVILYGYLAYAAGLYGNAGLNTFYAGMQIYGWMQWRKNTNGDALDVKVRTVPGWMMCILGSVVILACTGLSLVFKYYTDNPQPLLDAMTTVWSVMAMWLMVKRYSEQWLFWIAVNIASIIMWAIPAMQGGGGLALVAMYSVFLLNSLYGAYKWFIVEFNK